MSDDEHTVHRNVTPSKRPRGSSPVETQEEAANESQLSTFSIDEEITCICLGVLDTPYVVIPCLHTFDKDCLSGWWQRNNTCPLCKTIATVGRHSFQLQAIVDHYDNKRPPHKRARASGDTDRAETDKADIHPFGIAPPLPFDVVAEDNDDEDDHDWDDDEDEDEELEEDDHLWIGGRLIFPCAACRPGHPSGYTCQTPIPEPTEEMKQFESQTYLNGRRIVTEPQRRQRRVPFNDGLQNLPGTEHLFTDNFKDDLNRACAEHVVCGSCTTYIPANRPRRLESTCVVCSRTNCSTFDPLGCPFDFGQFAFKPFNELGENANIDGLWFTLTAVHFHFSRNMIERQRFTNRLTASNLTGPMIVQEIVRAAGHDVNGYFCAGCENTAIIGGIAAWWQEKQDSGTVPVPAEVANLPDCWYGKTCRTQSHNAGHAGRFNHNCDPRPEPQAQN